MVGVKIAAWEVVEFINIIYIVLNIIKNESLQ